MNKVIELLQSRKFWAMITVVVSTSIAMAGGEIAPWQGFAAIAGVVSAWIVAQSQVDRETRRLESVTDVFDRLPEIVKAMNEGILKGMPAVQPTADIFPPSGGDDDGEPPASH